MTKVGTELQAYSVQDETANRLSGQYKNVS